MEPKAPLPRQDEISLIMRPVTPAELLAIEQIRRRMENRVRKVRIYAAVLKFTPLIEKYRKGSSWQHVGYIYLNFCGWKWCIFDRYAWEKPDTHPQFKMGWQARPKGYRPVGSYNGDFPIQKLQKPFIVVDECWSKNGSLEVKIHDDRDDIEHEFLTPESWHLWPNKKKLAQAYNLRYTKAVRMRILRSNSFTKDISDMIDAEHLSINALNLQKQILNGDEICIAGQLDWSPSGQVWKDGEQWVVIPPPSISS